MKETRFFYAPQAAQTDELPAEEAAHAVRVVRLAEGDEMMLMDGQGTFYRAEVTVATGKRCLYRIVEAMPQERQWAGRIHLAIAPTKMMERMEWMAEKATEVGFDELTFLACRFSERKVVKAERVERIVVSAAKQSHKAWMPVVSGLTPFAQFIKSHTEGARFIAHCYEEVERTDLFDELKSLPDDVEATVLVGPEGDFSIEEVREAVAAGCRSVSLGRSRLRTETAGLAAVMMCQLSKEAR